MNKIGLIIHREFLNRVQKKSFVLSTILVPLIFPTIGGIILYAFFLQQKTAPIPAVLLVDESGLIAPGKLKKMHLQPFDGTIESAKETFQYGEHFGLLHVPDVDLSNPVGITLFTKVNPGPGDFNYLKKEVEHQIREAKISTYNIDPHILSKLKTNIAMQSVVLDDAGQEELSHTTTLYFMGTLGGILVYIFIFLYGSQIMNGVIEEKTSKVVEIIVSSVRPFQLMMGKIIGLALVGLLQFFVWVVLIRLLFFVVLHYYGKDILQMVGGQSPAVLGAMGGNSSDVLLEMVGIGSLPIAYIIFWFVFFFLGGYLLYGALFAAVGAAVDSPSEAQQFVFPITIPMLVSYMALFSFILDDPHGSLSVWLSIIPLTSPIAMVGRLGFGVPVWQLALATISLVVGFIFTTWVAARIYRVGILMHGSKVNYTVLLKWLLMKG